jgi:hypothetical protein
MGKKRKNKKSEAKSGGIDKAKPPLVNLPAPIQEDDTFDFGGLPSRDLKKNLGCG